MSRPTVDIFPAALLSHIDDKPTNQAKDELAKTGSDLAKIPFLRGAMHTITIPATSNERLSHKLGRVPQGWIVVGATGGPSVCYETESNARFLALQNDLLVDVTLKVWVF
jgi:hypothetical protein